MLEIKKGDILIYKDTILPSVNWTTGKEYEVFVNTRGELYVWTDYDDMYFLARHTDYINTCFMLKQMPQREDETPMQENAKTYVRLKISPTNGSNARVNEPLLHFFLSFYDYADASSWRDSKEVFLQGWITTGNKRKLLDEISTFFGLDVEEW